MHNVIAFSPRQVQAAQTLAPKSARQRRRLRRQGFGAPLPVVSFGLI